MQIEKLKEKKLLILGFGREGKSTLNFLKKLFPKKEIGIADKNKRVRNENFKNVKWHLGKNYLKAIKSYDLVIKSPGVFIHLPEVEKAFKEGKVTSQTEIFFQNCKGKIIGITGTKGKSTTAYLTYKILKKDNFKVHLVGNIGKPALNYLFSDNPNKCYVYELSAHQLYNLKKSPKIAVFLNVFPEHLDYYKNFKEYLMAKANVALWQKRDDFLIYSFEDKNVRESAKKSKAKKIPLRNCLKILREYEIKITPQRKHFSQNFAAAIKVAEIFGIKKERIKKALLDLEFLPHRLEFVGSFRGIEFYNDSLSTIPETTIQALNTLGEKVQTLILGGKDRNLNFEKLAKEVLKRKIKNLIFFPETGDKIWREILKFLKDEKDLPKAFIVFRMKDAVKLAFECTKKGEVCLLSPASPSFSLFKDYKERGNFFKKYVKEYGKS
jgi:UDP-N-acetylmuramoylalanine--D-glutamate ligase